MTHNTRNYTEQYTYAKKSLIQAIHAGQNIVLYGGGGNGKSHLLSEGSIGALLENANYTKFHIEQGRHIQKGTKLITCVNCLEECLDTFPTNAFVLINMAKFNYPGSSIHRRRAANGIALRSGFVMEGPSP